MRHFTKLEIKNRQFKHKNQLTISCRRFAIVVNINLSRMRAIKNI